MNDRCLLCNIPLENNYCKECNTSYKDIITFDDINNIPSNPKSKIISMYCKYNEINNKSLYLNQFMELISKNRNLFKDMISKI